MSNCEPTKYLEANALLAVQDHNEDLAKEKLRKLLPGELRELLHTATRLTELCSHVEKEFNEVERRPWRALIYVVERNDSDGKLAVQLPGWHSEKIVSIDRDIVPPEIWKMAHKGKRFHAQVNLGAERQEDLYFTEWELS